VRFLYLVLLSLTTGVLVGKTFSPYFGNIYEILLYILIFFIGMDLGLNFKAEELRRVGHKELILPFLTLFGSVLGGLIASLIVGAPIKWGVVIGSGCGWYSFTGPLIAQYSTIYGAVGFLANLIREILTVLLYPVTTRKIDPKRAVVIGGATTMDTTLPIIARFGGRTVALAAFVHGLILTALIPFVLPLLLAFFGY